jgi:hypothetical protein
VVMTSVIPLAFALQIPGNIGGLGLLNTPAAFSQVRQKSTGDRGPAADNLGPILFLL